MSLSQKGRMSILRMSALRQALVLTLAFLVLLAATGALVLSEFSRQFNHRIERELRSRFAIIEREIAETGFDSSRYPDNLGERVMLLSGRDQIRPGFHEALRQRRESFRDERHRRGEWMYLAGPRGERQLVVGTSLGRRDEFLEIMLAALMLVGGLAAGLAAGFGLFLGLRTQRRLSAVTTTLQRVADGDLTARVHSKWQRDDLDDLASQVDTTLSRVDLLVRQSRDFSANIAHDLKTPLARLHIRLEKALEAELNDGNSVEFIEASIEQTDKVIAIFDAFLRISKLEAGTAKEVFDPLNLGEIAREMAEIYMPVVEDSGRKLMIDIKNPVTLDGDRVLLMQALANLIENAMCHTPAGTELLLIANKSTLGLADTGPGIPAHEIKNVTQPLYRLERSRTTEGAGLGLSLVKTIAQLHGAELDLASNPRMSAGGLQVLIRFPDVD